ncbi:aldehyde dehydrogenase family protein, partial [Salmonella enterica subsp. enterica serovar Enteritidis]|nr:aldehyde dehydrogenase family protein [Salmonella enterica subsp. enterica serovar Enteritidis]
MANAKQFYINGEWVDPVKPHDHPVIDPSTEQPFATISLGSAADCDRAVAAAKAAFPAWAATPPAERRALVERILEQYEKRKEEMAQAISQEMGAP